MTEQRGVVDRAPRIDVDGPDPECVGGAADDALAAVDVALAPKPAMDHSKPVQLTRKLIPVAGN